jgi:hypothetical protein
MPRYFFHLSSDGYAIADHEGVELRELSAAHRHAIKLQEQIRLYCPEPPCEWIVKVGDDSGTVPLVILPSASARSIAADNDRNMYNDAQPSERVNKIPGRAGG